MRTSSISGQGQRKVETMQATKTNIQGRVRKSMLLTIFACGCLIVAAIVWPRVAHGTLPGDATIHLSASEKVTYPVSLPNGYESPTGITSGASGPWIFASGLVNGSPIETVFHYTTSSNSLSAFNVDVSNPALDAGTYTPIVEDTSGNAWVGINASLVVVSPNTGVTESLNLPPVTLGDPGSGLPSGPGPDPTATAPVDSLGIDASGNIVVARMFATELQIVDPTTLDISTLPLPSGYSLAGLGEEDIAVDPLSGTIAAVLYGGNGAHKLGQFSAGNWTLSGSPCAAYAVSYSSGVIDVRGPSCAETGSSLLLDSPAHMRALKLSSTPFGVQCFIEGSGGNNFLCTDSGLEISTPNGEAKLHTLGSFFETQPSVSGRGPSTISVQLLPKYVAATPNGSVWFVPNVGPNKVGLIS
jgi:hypothetical protein